LEDYFCEEERAMSKHLEAFTRAMREGDSRDGSHLFAAFPFNAYTELQEDDVKALYADHRSTLGMRSYNITDEKKSDCKNLRTHRILVSLLQGIL
jgi:hypothetical protein